MSSRPIDRAYYQNMSPAERRELGRERSKIRNRERDAKVSLCMTGHRPESMWATSSVTQRAPERTRIIRDYSAAQASERIEKVLPRIEEACSHFSNQLTYVAAAINNLEYDDAGVSYLLRTALKLRRAVRGRYQKLRDKLYIESATDWMLITTWQEREVNNRRAYSDLTKRIESYLFNRTYVSEIGNYHGVMKSLNTVIRQLNIQDRNLKKAAKQKRKAPAATPSKPPPFANNPRQRRRRMGCGIHTAYENGPR